MSEHMLILIWNIFQKERCELENEIAKLGWENLIIEFSLKQTNKPMNAVVSHVSFNMWIGLACLV
jgi:hypothetical protein